jgi:TRAP-type C4-dicarboxylate transport system substrate-binding protein
MEIKTIKEEPKMKTAHGVSLAAISRIVVTSLIGALLLSSVWYTSARQAFADEKVYVLKCVSVYPSTHPSIVHGVMPWIEELKQKSKGRLIVQFYEPNTLCPMDEAWTAVKSGIADIAFHANRSLFPLSDVVAMPFMFKSAEAAALTLWEMINEFPEMAVEYKGAKLLWAFTSAEYQLHTKKIKVSKLSDIKGKKIIVWTPNGRKYAAALGAVPVAITPLDTYMALQRSMADGVFCPLAPMRSYKTDEVTKYHNIINFSQDPFWGAMNINSFEKLPPDLQKLLLDTCGTPMARLFGKTLDDGDTAAIKYLKSKGHVFIDIPENEIAGWRAQVTSVYEAWIKDMEGRGYKDARKMFETAQKLSKKYQAEIDAR